MSANDPLRVLLLDVSMDEAVRRELEALLGRCQPWPWEVLEAEDEYVVAVTGTGDPIATLPKDQYGRDHAKLMAAAPLLALQILDAIRRAAA